MSKQKKFTVDQPVMMTRTYGKPRPAVITRLGSKYAYAVAGDYQMQVDLFTGAGVHGFGRVWTMPEWEERARLDELHAELRAHGIGPVGTSRFKQSIETLEALLAVLQRPAEGGAK